MAVGTAAAGTAGKIAWELAKALVLTGSIVEAGNILKENFNEIKKIGFKEDYLNELIRNPESIADKAWEEYEQETLYPNENDEKSNNLEEHYEKELAANNSALKKLEGVDFDKITNKNNEEKEKDPIPPISGMDTILPGDSSNGQGGIQDNTDLNLGTNNMTPLDWISWAEEQQRKQWEREDRIRRETQEREDTAWQRGVDDMLRSGINPNLVGAQPAESGGGITQATGIDTSTLTSQMNISLEEMQQIIDNAFKGNENDKDRFVEVLGKIINFIGLLQLTKGKK